ncbi:phage tail-collar fiber domain-containing protein [Enterobacter hormaechei]|uniref:phage tail-collar fiber domain-containing protein n=1 Tax=Enterobacter hormaechei TaxID=158836 RepID=UPI0027398F84|nr:phage tail protein [Enterobacter hormaechei]MDZ5680132.1 phage tail protein [Enterobacter hormaechei]WLP09488.1 phage tail protein [Enterobacter hormaechei]HCD9773175.1 phage tail protein [Enterobacter hormaechei]HCE3973109.1 phage tail protein [Enterobacter hormaechei]
MAEKYYSILTNRGKELETQSSATGKPVIIKDFVVGDGNGQAVKPDPAQTKLVREVYRSAISALQISPDQANQFIAQLVLPVNVGGFVVREVGLLTDAGELYSVANCAAIEKPENGVSVNLQYRLAVSETAAVELKVATGDGLFLRLDRNLGEIAENGPSAQKSAREAIDVVDATTSRKGLVQLSNATDTTSEEMAATPKAVKAAYDLADGKYTAQDATTARKGIVQLSSATDSTSEALAATPKAVKAVNDNANGRVPSARKVNGRALASDISITAQDIFNGQAVAIGNAADLNAYTTPGLYYQPANAQAQTGRNYPEANAGSLEVYKHAGITQIYRIYNSSRSYIRTLYSGTWSAWVKQYDAANKPSPADINAVNKGGDTMTGGLKIRAADALRIYDAAYGMIFRRSENNFYLIPTAKDQGEDGGISGLRPLYIDLTNGRVTLGNGAVVNGGLGLGVVSGLGGNSIALGDNDTGFKQNGDGVLDVYANSKQVMRFLNSGITSYMLFNMNAGASVSSTLTFKNGSGITSEKTGANPRNGQIYWGGDASRGNRIEFADDAGWKAYIERHPSNGVQLVVNGRINGSIVYSSGEVLAGGGSAHFAADGNIFGSKWGNQWLDVYLRNTYQPKGNYTPAGQAYTKVESDGRFQPKGSYTPAGQAYTKAESDARYNLKNTATKSANAMTHKDASTGVMEVVMSNINVPNKTNVNVTFPAAFPNACVGVVITYNGAGHGSGDDSAIYVPSYSRTGCTLYAHNADGKFMLIAKGY